MSLIRPSLKTLRALAGEGNFHAYRLLGPRGRVFLFAKCLFVSLAHSLKSGDSARNRTVVFVKGKNQLRYQNFLASQIEAEFGSVDVFTASRLPSEAKMRRLVGFPISGFLRQAFFLLLMLATGRKRYLNLYLLSFQAEMDRLVKASLENIECFICLNDQPYDVAAILNALHRRSDCRTIVVQHGLILNESFYFPSVAREFWAWGRLSERYYRSWDGAGKIFLRGRYANDATRKVERYVLPPAGKPVNILIAPSFFHAEVKEIVSSLKCELSEEFMQGVTVAMKFHPATKFTGWLKCWCALYAPWLKIESDAMETLSEKYDSLVTKNSTSAIDFLLRGKPVFFHPPSEGADFPSLNYGFALSQISIIKHGGKIGIVEKGIARRAFLINALNV